MVDVKVSFSLLRREEICKYFSSYLMGCDLSTVEAEPLPILFEGYPFVRELLLPVFNCEILAWPESLVIDLDEGFLQVSEDTFDDQLADGFGLILSLGFLFASTLLFFGNR